ncbi:MAG: hypothetical protein DME19_11420 [Verrucomicrobia bacterium]|nr:MAG: hypothetical protein DME19_11420 [Verrucomicrobiota bacterium]
MANILQVNEREAILTLAAQGWAIRRIARELKIHRHTIQRYVQQSKEDSKCTTISTAGSPSKCTISTAGKIGRKSVCNPHRKLIEEKAGQGLSAQRIYQDLKIEVQFTGSYESVKPHCPTSVAVTPRASTSITATRSPGTATGHAPTAPGLSISMRHIGIWVLAA